MNAIGSGYNRLERGFIAEQGNRASAGAFGRRVYGRPAPAPAAELEVETILARCRARRAGRAAPDGRHERRRRGNGDTLAYIATGLSLLALSAVSALPMF
jgi:hypothetical protein